MRNEIDEYIQSLNYDPRQLLSVQADGHITTVPVTERSQKGNAIIISKKIKHSISKSLSEVALLNATAGVIYPGALVLADRNLMEGRPTPIGLARGPVTISVDLPGLQPSERTIEVPTNSSVQEALAMLLEQWNQEAKNEGYSNAARSFREVKKAYSSQQLALDLGFNAKWATGNAASQLAVSDSSEQSVIVAYYKQVFYTVSVNAPSPPSSVFATSLSREDVERATNAEHPPAYVRSVDYGRILMIRMETSVQDTEAKIMAAFKQATSGGVQLEGNTDSTIKKIIENSTFQVLAIGGNAENAARFQGNQDDLQKLQVYIQAGSTYSRGNPGGPISYGVAFLKDHELATMGFTTEYTETQNTSFDNGFIGLKHSGGYVAKFEITWQEFDGSGTVQRKWESGKKTAGYTHQIDLPGDASDIKVRGWAATGLAWDPWGEIFNISAGGPTNKWYNAEGTTLHRKWSAS